MSASYDIVNLISSFGFSEIWRAACVRNLSIPAGATVADLMSGSGECWSYLNRRLGQGGRIISVDISPAMCQRQHRRLSRFRGAPVEIIHGNALKLKQPDGSVDFIISAFGLKTFDQASLKRLAEETFRLLRKGGSCSFLEISLPTSRLLRVPYHFYIGTLIPLVGRIFLKNIECYRMLGVYTEAFGSCDQVVEHFRSAGFQITLKTHFFGCATSIIATKASDSSLQKPATAKEGRWGVSNSP